MPHAVDRQTSAGRASLWIPVALYAVAIFLASSIEHPGTLPGHTPDYVAHAMLYAGFAAVILRALSGARWLGVTPRSAAAAVAGAVLYGLTDEIHQLFVPGRSFQATDLLADLVGAALGVGAVLALARAVQIRRPADTGASR
jgi:VanZ family protein